VTENPAAQFKSFGFAAKLARSQPLSRTQTSVAAKAICPKVKAIPRLAAPSRSAIKVPNVNAAIIAAS